VDESPEILNAPEEDDVMLFGDLKTEDEKITFALSLALSEIQRQKEEV